MARFAENSSHWQERFLVLLPRIINCVMLAFRTLRPEERDEAIQESVVSAFIAYAGLVKQGREGLAFATVLAKFAIRQVRVGRQIGCTLNSSDVSSPYAQIKKRFRLARLDRFDPVEGFWKESIVEDFRTPVADQACFRVDFPAWLKTLPRRDRKIAEALADGHRTTDVARRFQISLGRVSQLRREFERSWLAFHGEEAESEQMSLLQAA